MYDDRKIGGNTSQKVDGHIGDKLLVCVKRMVPQIEISTKDKQWTLLELTAFSGDPIMCVAIIAGIREQAVVDKGMDMFAEQEGEVSDVFFKNNSGRNK